MKPRNGWMPVTLAGVTLVAAACGGGSSGDAGRSGDDGRPQSFSEIEFRSPLSEFLGYEIGMSNDEAQAQWAAQATEAEEKIVACMAAEGFEYKPMDHSQMTMIAMDEGLEYFSAEWIEKYGFGITTQRFAQSAVGPDLVGYDDEAMSGAEEEFVDPNQGYVDSLSDAERDAYYIALYGDSPAFDEYATDEEVEAAMVDYVPSGCQNKAWNATGGGDGDFWNEFSDELEEMYERIEADPRVVAHRREVAACVAEQGLTFTDMDELYSRWDTRLNELDPWSSGDPLAEAGLDPEKMTDEELNDFYREIQKLDADALSVLAAVQAEELELARAMVECDGGPLNDEILIGEVRVEIEQQFLDDNRERIAGYEGSARPGAGG